MPLKWNYSSCNAAFVHLFAWTVSGSIGFAVPYACGLDLTICIASGAFLIIAVRIAHYDFVSFRIQDVDLVFFSVVGVIFECVRSDDWMFAWPDIVMRSVMYALTFELLSRGYKLIRRRRGLGLGDVKLAAGLGIWLDVSTFILTLALASALALTFYLFRALIRRQSTRRISPVPLGAFLAPSGWTCWILAAISHPAPLT